MVKKLLIVGPSNDINNFSREDIIRYKSEGFDIFSFSDSLIFFLQKNINPDYYSFLDPFTLSHYLNELEKGFCSKTTLITPDIYKNELEGFFGLGYTCNSLKKNHKVYNKIINLDLSNIFKTHIAKPYKITDFNNFINNDFKKNYYMLKNPGYNFCKFSFIILPLILNHFKDLNELKVIGFGHYSVGRYFYKNGNNKGYEEFKNSYKKIKTPLKKELEKNNIKISFDGSESFYKELSII